jgi:hypothetical protein
LSAFCRRFKKICCKQGETLGVKTRHPACDLDRGLGWDIDHLGDILQQVVHAHWFDAVSDAAGAGILQDAVDECLHALDTRVQERRVRVPSPRSHALPTSFPEDA